jgi:acyl dehydratase
MTLRRDPGADCRLYLEDLHVGQRFVSRSHGIDKEQIKAFAAQFDPQAFHLDDEAATTLFGGLAASGWHTAAITMRCLSTAEHRSQAALSVPEGRSVGQGRQNLTMCSRWKVRYSKERRPAQSWIAAW